ncbi:MAG: 5-oxoprolinase [Phycisphaeraceae bacterium]|nr:5-oxoprolinase [Phycisphaeraceae bacterium]|tara:strand:- start:1263 stop:2996 length:1734 start_codon:yes stop_codon:yes gene_type:complete
MSTNPDINPIQFEVIRNALMEITEEMAIALRRSAYSTNIKTRADFSCAFFDRQLQAVAQAFTQPAHLGSLSELVPQAIKTYGPENMGPGDAILTNDPYRGGGHLNDITLISPVYSNGELLGYVANLAHHVDVGGGAPASIGAFQEVFQEGIIIHPVKLVHAGEMIDDVMSLLLAQIRSKRETAGDFRAQIAANRTGARRVDELVQRVGADLITRCMNQLIEYTETRTRTELARLPKGVFTADGCVDNDGFTDKPVNLTATVTLDDTGILFDFTGCDPQRPAPVNSTYAQTFAACAYAIKCLIDPDVPVNSGFYRAVRLITPKSSVVNCSPPAPVVGGWETQVRLNEVIFRALSSAVPDQIAAETKGMMAQVGFGGIDPKSGNLYSYYETVAGGYGARAASDGPEAVQCHGQNTENAPIEEIEINYPVRIERYELINDSEGPGRFRGGLGLQRDYTFLNHEVSFTILADRDRWGPRGLLGGKSGLKASYLHKSRNQKRALGSKTTVELIPGEVISYRTSGGGGYGLPYDRDPQHVLDDVRNGKVSAQRAQQIYGVVIDTSRWEVNQVDSEALRSAGKV